MDNYHLPMVVMVITERQSLEVLERHRVAESVLFTVRLNRDELANITFRDTETPRITLANDRFSVWAESRMYEFSGGELAHTYDIDDEIYAIYFVDHHWWIVCELSVQIYQAGNVTPLSRAYHNNPIVAAWWTLDGLHISDLNHRELHVILDSHTVRLELLQHNT